MKVCPNCFSDKELIGFISASTEIGDCEVCNSKSQPQLDVSELFDFFQELIENFKVSKKGIPISSKIHENWTFFSSHDIADKILNLVLPKLTTEIESSKTIVNYIDDIIENCNHWEVLKDEIKWKNRFIINIERLVELGWDGFFNSQFKLTQNDKLYRARLHHQSGLDVYKPTEMTSPPKESANGGRANPQGIPFLYLSDNPETVLYEVRASFLDELSIGTFNLIPNVEFVQLVDFTEDTSLFQPNSLSINKIIKGKLLKQNISSDLSKPMRRYDSELEYIPTQFICEFIKIFTGASGIIFNSSLHPKGKNIVLFDQDIMACEATKIVKINAINLNSIEVFN